MKLKTKIKIFYKNIVRNSISKKNAERFNKRNITILSQNCLGGIMYHDLKEKFNSPTINMFFKPSDFIKFCSDLKHYLYADMTLKEQNEYNYPVVMLDDIELHCVHYDSLEDVKNSWKKRVERINYDEIFVIMCQRDGCTNDDLLQFDKLDFDNKIVFVNKEMKNIKSSCYIKELEKEHTATCVADLSKFKTILSGKRNLDYFDWVSFLNRDSKYNRK